MDIMTLNAVIARLQKDVNMCNELMKLANERGDEDVTSMWAYAKIQAQHSLNAVSSMLDDELEARDREAA